MTNSSLRFALKGAFALAALVFAGCGERDGRAELEEGWAACEAHDLAKADRLFGKSVACDAENVDALVASARVKLQLGKLSEAKALIDQAAARAGEDDDVILLGAQIAYHLRDYSAATEAYAKFAADTGRSAEARADALVGLAVVKMTGNEHDRARIALLRAQQLDRHNAAARYHLGFLYRTLGYEEAALEQFQAYVMLDKEDSVRVQRVQKQDIRDLKDAIAHKAAAYPGVDKRDSALASSLLRKAEEAARKGNAKTARARYEEALKADPLSYPAALGLAQLLEKTSPSASLDAYQKACALKPSAISTHLKAGALALERGRVATAVAVYSAALAADPKKAESIDGLIRALRKTGPSGVATAALWQDYRNSLVPPTKRK